MMDDKVKISNAEASAQANRLALKVVSLIHSAGGGHFGGALSALDILTVLFRDIMDLDGECGQRDHFVLSKGHAAASLYCVMAEFGLMPDKAMDGFGRRPDALGGHPEAGQPFIDVSTGSLGQGLSVALGLALVLRERKRRVFVLLGDGECQEGQVWEAAMLAGRIGLGNLTAIVDCNGLQEYGFRIAGVQQPPIHNIVDKWSSFGWATTLVNGHSAEALRDALSKQFPKPAAVLAQTHKGRNVSFFSDNPERAHCTDLSEAEFSEIME